MITASRQTPSSVARTERASLMDASLHLSLWMWASLGVRTDQRAHALCPASAAKLALGRTGRTGTGPHRHWAAPALGPPALGRTGRTGTGPCRHWAAPALGRAGTGPRRHWTALCMLCPRRLRLLVCIPQPRPPWSVLQILHSAFGMPGRHGIAEGPSPHCVFHGADGVYLNFAFA